MTASQKPSWESLHAAGLTIREAAKARGVHVCSAYNWEYRNPGKRFARPSRSETSRALSKSRLAYMARPGTKDDLRAIARSVAEIRSRLSPEERDRYREYRDLGATRREALDAIKRKDLINLVWP